MPSRYSSPDSLEDAADVARRLGIRLDVIPVTGPFDAHLDALSDVFAATEQSVAVTPYW